MDTLDILDMLETKTQMAWWDYAKEEYVWRTEGPQDDETALQYLPQYPAAKGLYEVRRELGDTILEAMIKVLDACVGEAE